MNKEPKIENPNYVRAFLRGFVLSFLVFLILAYCRNNGFVPFRYLFF